MHDQLTLSTAWLWPFDRKISRRHQLWPERKHRWTLDETQLDDINSLSTAWLRPFHRKTSRRHQLWPEKKHRWTLDETQLDDISCHYYCLSLWLPLYHQPPEATLLEMPSRTELSAFPILRSSAETPRGLPCQYPPRGKIVHRPVFQGGKRGGRGDIAFPPIIWALRQQYSTVQ